jgi:uncharacterized protein with GYD domain
MNHASEHREQDFTTSFVEDVRHLGERQDLAQNNREGVGMPTYVIGARLTGNSTKEDQSFAQQLEAINQVRQQYGGRLISAYVTFGRYDLLFIVDYPDQKSALAAVETNLAKGLFTLEVGEALAVEDFLKMTDD